MSSSTLRQNIEVMFKNGIWLPNDYIDSVIYKEKFEYLSNIDGYEFLLKEKEKEEENEFVVIDNNIDKHIFISINRNRSKNYLNNFKIGCYKPNCKSYRYHFALPIDFVNFLHNNDASCVATFLNIHVEDSAPTDN